MKKVIILGSGAAPGVPSLSMGWGACNPDNPYNLRTRTGTYLDYDGVKILIDTSPDIRAQMIRHDIRTLDAVLYTHRHADHLYGIDDLREINRISCRSLDIFGNQDTVKAIKKGFHYLVASRRRTKNVVYMPSLLCNQVKANHPFYVKELKITPLKLLGHLVPSIGYAFNDGEIVYIADFKRLASSVYAQILQRPKLLIIPLTTPFGQPAHASLEEVLHCIEKINPERAIINHMATDCDYDEINRRTPNFVAPAYDGLTLNIE